jgi:hypothetical protein
VMSMDRLSRLFLSAFIRRICAAAPGATLPIMTTSTDASILCSSVPTISRHLSQRSMTPRRGQDRWPRQVAKTGRQETSHRSQAAGEAPPSRPRCRVGWGGLGLCDMAARSIASSRSACRTRRLRCEELLTGDGVLVLHSTGPVAGPGTGPPVTAENCRGMTRSCQRCVWPGAQPRT